MCEPQMGKRGLYPAIGGNQKQKMAGDVDEHINSTLINPRNTRGDEIEAMMWVMFYADGKHSILDIAELTKNNQKTPKPSK